MVRIEDKEREKRRDNIVIKEITIVEAETIGAEWVQGFLRSRLEIKTKILTYRKSGDIIVAKVENKEKKIL